MELRDTILGLLCWQPASGYDLKRIISASEVFYWSGNNNQIYKNLLALQQEGLVTSQVQLQEGLPAKKVYSLTAQGLSSLRQSLLADPQPPELHKIFLIQLAWAESLSDEEVLELLEKYTHEIEARLLLLGGQAARGEQTPARSKREQYLWQRITANLFATYQAELVWARQTQHALREKNY